MRRKINKWYLRIFELQCPEIVDADEVYETDDDRLVAKMSDGYFLVYDLILGTSMRTDDPYKKYNPQSEGEFRKYFSRKLYREMRRKGFDQDDISIRTGLSAASISKYVNGNALPTAYNLILLAKALKCDPAELIDL